MPTVWFRAADCGQTDNIQVPHLQTVGVSHEDASSAVPCSHIQQSLISKNASVHVATTGLRGHDSPSHEGRCTELGGLRMNTHFR